MNPTKGDQDGIEMHCFSGSGRHVAPSIAYAIYVDSPKNSASSESVFGSETATVGSEYSGNEPVIQTELPRYGYIPPAEGSELPSYGCGHLSSPHIPDNPPRYRAYDEMEHYLPPPTRPTRPTRPNAPWSIIRRLSFAKPDRSFCQYFPFALDMTFAEVESMLFLDIFILFSGVWILSMAFLEMNNCPSSENFSLSALIYGVSAIISSAAFLGIQCHDTGRRSVWRFTVLVICRLLRLGMVFVCIAGMNRLYHNYPPEEIGVFVLGYCQGWLYWSEAFVYLVYFACFVVTLLQGIMFGLWYLC